MSRRNNQLVNKANVVIASQLAQHNPMDECEQIFFGPTSKIQEYSRREKTGYWGVCHLSKARSLSTCQHAIPDYAPLIGRRALCLETPRIKYDQ